MVTKLGVFQGNLGLFPAVVVATELCVFKVDLGRFPSMFVEIKMCFLLLNQSTRAENKALLQCRQKIIPK